MIGEYAKGLLMQMENISLINRRRLDSKFPRIVADLKREIFLDGYYKAFGLAAGPWRFCKPRDTNKPYKYPHWARPSMEACGIDVSQTARNCEFELEVVRSEDFLYSLVALIFIQ